MSSWRTPLAILASLAGQNCTQAAPIHQVVVTATEYAFGVPDTLPPGLTVFRLKNDGNQRHEMVLARLKDGIALSLFVRAMATDADVGALIDLPGGATFARPGFHDNPMGIAVVLVRGRSYVIWCGFRDSPEAPMHSRLGMFKQIVVR